MNQDYQNLLQRIVALEKWKADRERQQITFPLDTQSQTILGKYFMNLENTFNFIVYGAADHPVRRFIGKQGNMYFEVTPQALFQYRVVPSTDVITVLTVNGERFANDDAVLFTTDDTLPSPLDGTTTYYVVNADASGTSFKVSLTVGGAAVNITDIGTGAQYIYREL